MFFVFFQQLLQVCPFKSSHKVWISHAVVHAAIRLKKANPEYLFANNNNSNNTIFHRYLMGFHLKFLFWKYSILYILYI